MKNYYEVIEENKLKSNFVIAGFIAFFAAAVYLISYAIGDGTASLLTAVIFSTVLSIGGYWYSDKIILTMSGAREASRKEFFDFYTVTENISKAAQVPMPKLYVIEDTAMNAFATGRDPEHAVVCATTGLLKTLTRGELEGVVAHEVSHIRHFDIRLMAVITVLVGSITLLADWLLRISFHKNRDSERSGYEGLIMVLGFIMAILSPIIAQIIQLAISRRREFFADAGAVSITKNPNGLINALKKISQDSEPLEAANKATAHLYIDNPFKSNLKNKNQSPTGWFANLFNTHPSVKDRISALQGL